MNPEQEKLVRDLVAAGDKATQGQWQPIQLGGELGPCAIKCGQSLLAREPNYAERDVAQNRADFVFLASAANARDAIKALLAERDAMREALEEIAECDEDAWGVYHDHAESIGGHERTEPSGFNASERARAALRDLEPKEAEDGKA